MSIMVSREECVSAINKFIETKSIKDGVVLFKLLCDYKNVLDTKDEVEAICNSQMVLSMLLPQTIEQLSVDLKIKKITDRNNNLITVY